MKPKHYFCTPAYAQLSFLVLSRIFWSLLFVIGTVLTIYNVVTLVEDFLAFGVETNIELVQAKELDFPAVTICNANRIHCGELHNFIKDCVQVKTHITLCILNNKLEIDQY